MAVQVNLARASRRIAEVIRKFAESEGVAMCDYAVVASYDPAADRIRMTLGSDRNLDQLHWHRNILQGIRAAFPEDPSITSHLGLVIRNVANLEDLYRDAAFDEDLVDLTEVFEQAR